MRKTDLLVIDVQKGLDDPSLGKRNNPEANMVRLMAAWQGLVIFRRATQHGQALFLRVALCVFAGRQVGALLMNLLLQFIETAVPGTPAHQFPRLVRLAGEA
jgi:nicotinamidase-related amidase